MQTTRKASLWRALAAIVTGALFASAAVVGVAVPANAASGTATLTWGIKSSFVTYVTGPIASGAIIATGSGVTGTYPYTWSGGASTVDADAGTGTASFTDGIHFTGHSGALDLTISNPEITLTGSTTATLYADVVSKSLSDGTVTTYTDVDLATLTLSTPTISGSTATYTDVAAYLTADGAPAFAGFYSAGTQLDNLTFSVPYTAPATATATTLSVDPADTAVVGDAVTLTATVSPAAAGSVEFFDGSASLGTATVSSGTATTSVSTLAEGDHSFTATFTPADSSAYIGSTSSAVSYAVTADETTSAVLSVSPSTALDPDGATLTVTGSGYPGSTVYLQVGSILTDSWAPSAGGVNNTDRRGVSSLTQVVGSASYATVSFDENGSFTTTVTVTQAALDAVALDGGVFAVYTVGAGGAVDAANEAYAEFSFAAAAAATTTTLSVSPESATEGAEVALTATVSPAASGSVEFFDGSASLGTAVVSAGVATKSVTTLAEGDHSLTAVFTPADSAAYLGSTSSALSFSVTAAPIAQVTVDKTTGLNAAGDTVHVTGTGFTATKTAAYPPVAGYPAGFYVAFGKFSDVWQPTISTTKSSDRLTGLGGSGLFWVVPQVTYDYVASVYGPTGSSPNAATFAQFVLLNADGSFSLDLAVSDTVAGKFTASTAGNYGVYTYQTSTGANAAIETYTPISFAVPAVATTTTLSADPSSTAVAGTAVNLTATVSPAASGTVEFFDGSTSLGTAAVSAGVATTSVSTLAEGDHSLTAVFSPADASAYVGSTSAAVSYSVTAAPVAQVTVDKTSGLNASGDTVHVTGTGFTATKTAAYPPIAGYPAGFYVAFGKFSDVWQPSVSTTKSSDRLTGAGGSGLFWVVPQVTYDYVVSVYGPSGSSPNAATLAQFVLLNADGSFSLDLSVSDTVSGKFTASSAGNYGVYTYQTSTGANAAIETYTPISFAVPAVATTTTLSADPADTAAAGSEVDLTATVSPVASGSVEFFDGATSLGTASVLLGIATKTVTSLAAGDHSLTAVFTPTDTAAYLGSTSPAVSYTVTADSGISGATLRWGLKSSFTSYITGPIAQGSISTSGVSIDSGEFVWSNGSGTYATDTQTGEVAYSGSIHLTGHSGVLDMQLSNPRIVVTGATAAELYVDVVSKGYNGTSDVNQTGVRFATLTLPAGVSGEDGSITWTDAAAVLTAEGAAAFAGFYTAGTALDPVTFTFPVASTAPVTPVLSSSVSAVAPGETITFTGTGFDAYESVYAEVHSAVVELGSFAVTDGALTISWTVPTDFEAGTHTLVVLDGDGAQIASTTFTVTAVDGSTDGGTDTSGGTTGTTTAEAVCTANSVSGATISWGFKQSFVDYINGPIANGSISGGWGTGSGAYSVDNHSGSVRYSGSVHYYGHSGILDITLSNLRIQVTGPTTAVLYATTSSTGEIALANLSLPTASNTGSTISWSNASATITSAGSALFSYNGNAFYPAGTALDSISFSFPLGAEVACDSTTDGTLAVTGGSDADGVLWLGLAMLVLGVGAVAVRRRRTTRV